MASSTQTKDQGSYQTHRVQFLREITSRTDNTSLKDEDFLNCILESVKNKELDDNRHFIMKRAGSSKLIDSVASSEVRGMFYWDDADKLFYSVGTSVYVYNFSTSTNTALGITLTTSSGEVGFCEYLYDDNSVVIIVTDGTTLAKVDSSNTVTLCSDADLPTPHLPYPVFIDGYLFLAKANTAEVYNSDLNDPMSWTTTDFLTAEMKGDLVIRIATLNNYLLVFGSESIEYFWDAGNTSGSPMQRNDTPIKITKYIGGFSQFGNDIYFIGEKDAGQPEVFILRDFKIDTLSSSTVSRYLNTNSENSSTWKSGIISVQGHAMFVLSAGGTTYACDIESKFWTRWAFQTNASFPIVYSVRATTSTLRRSCFSLKGTDSSIYIMDDTLFRDNGVNFTVRIVTEAADFGTLNRKFMARFSLVGDRPSANSYVSLSWSDDDYQSFNTPVQFNMNQDLPCVYRLGQFRQRCFKIEYSDNYPFRVQRYEVDINKGIS